MPLTSRMVTRLALAAQEKPEIISLLNAWFFFVLLGMVLCCASIMQQTKKCNARAGTYLLSEDN